MRAWIAVAVFSLFGIISLVYIAPQDAVFFAQAFFYTVLVINTFFSIRFFSRLIPISTRQIVVDTVLVILYALLALTIGYSVLFPIVATCLFLVAAAKYAVELGATKHRKVLKRKIRIDLYAAMLPIAALVGTLVGYPQASAWVLAILFSLGNLYYLSVDPMYEL